MKYYYGFRFYSGKHTTTGEPNKRNGLLNIAGEPKAFKSISSRNSWLNKEKLGFASGLGEGKREWVSRKELRTLRKGCSTIEFLEILEQIQEEAE